MIRPYFASEKLLSGPPYFGCGISADFFGSMLASGNEAGLNKWARTIGQGGRRRILQRGWNAFDNQVPADANGWVDQGDLQLIHRAMFPDLPPIEFIGRLPLPDVWDAIGDYAVSMALDTGAVGSKDAIRRYVGAVPHQAVEWKKKGATFAEKRTLHMCPMHKASNSYQGHWVKWSSVVRCAKAIKGSDGEAFVVLYPINDWTEANLVRQRKNTAIRQQRAALTVANRENAALIEQLQECREDGPDDGVNDFIEEQIKWLEDQRR